MNLGMSEVNAKLQKDFGAEQTIIGPDRVHPSFCGGFVMLNRWLKDLESDSIPVSSVALDARNKRIASLVNCKVSEVEFSEDAIKFVSEEFSLPFPVDESAQKVLAYLPFQTKYNRQTLQIIGLNPGTYILSIGGNPVAEYSAKDLARGVNLSENRKTPQYAQAEAVYEKCSAFRNLAASFRSIAMVELLERKEFGKISDPMERIEYARSKLADKTADAVTLNVNSGTIQTRITGQTSAGTNVYGNVVFNINGGVLGKGTQWTGDCNVIGGLGEYNSTNPSVVIYGNNTLNIGSSSPDAAQPTIYGYITTQQGAIVKGNTYLNIMGGHITYESNTYSNVYGGPNYGGTVEGNVYVNISGGIIDRNVHGGGIIGAATGKILGSTNIVVSGGTILGDIYGGYSGEGGSANGTNITLIGDGNNITIGGVISGGNRGTDDCSLLGTKTLRIGTDGQGFVAADSQAFSIRDIDVVRITKGSKVAFSNDFSIDKLIVELNETALLADGLQP